MSKLLNPWNKENDAAVISPGDQDHPDTSKNLLITNVFEIVQNKSETPEFDINGTALNSL
ncbi:hypothetical protein [Peribacillus sp. SCS-155]|uniref:hypothetical protein n=1 Tax=Peribacillus sedimenti TaxID=3115297 RepID=UPI003905C6A7